MPFIWGGFFYATSPAPLPWHAGSTSVSMSVMQHKDDWGNLSNRQAATSPANKRRAHAESSTCSLGLAARHRHRCRAGCSANYSPSLEHGAAEAPHAGKWELDRSHLLAESMDIWDLSGCIKMKFLFGFVGFFLNDLPIRGFVSVSSIFRSALSDDEHL